MSYVHWPCYFFLQGIKDHGISIAFDTTQALCSIPHVRLGGMHRQAKTCLTFWMCPRDGYCFFWKKCGLTTNWPPMCLHWENSEIMGSFWGHLFSDKTWYKCHRSKPLWTKICPCTMHWEPTSPVAFDFDFVLSRTMCHGQNWDLSTGTG